MRHFTTSVFTLSPSLYNRHLLTQWFSRWWWLVCLPLFVLLVWSLFDWRMLVLASMLVCIIYPGILAIIYYNHALSPQATSNIIPHSISATADGITITYHHDTDDDRRPPQDRFIPACDVLSSDDMGAMMIISLKTGPYDIIIIPTSAITFLVDNDKN